MIKLSIIIPCYNCSATIRESFTSCFDQGFEDDEFEIILVDDGSTDDTPTVMKELRDGHMKNVHVIYHEKNLGGGATRNTGIASAKADCIFCLDSDDILPQQTLIKLYEYLNTNHCDGVAIHRFINFNGIDTKDIDHIVEMSYVGTQIPLESLLQKDGIHCGVYQVFMFTRHAFIKAGGYPTNHGFDTQGFAWRFLSAGLVAHTCPDTSYLQRINYKESYYLREYNAGRANINLQKILLEHINLFDTETQKFIATFPTQDFTRHIIDELGERKPALSYNKITEVIKLPVTEKRPVSRHSFLGVYMRIKNRYRKFLTGIKDLLRRNRVTYKITKNIHRNILRSPIIYFLRSSTEPLSEWYGLDRGEPVDRYFIEHFLAKNREYITGHCLELLNNNYTKEYGHNVTISDILDIENTNRNANVIADLRNMPNVPSNTYDCVILTQVLQFIDNLDAALVECHRILKPGGVILATLPAISRIDCASGTEGDFWRFTTASAAYLFGKIFIPNKIIIESMGNTRSGLYFYAGLAQEDINRRILQKHDPNFPTIITVVAIKS